MRGVILLVLFYNAVSQPVSDEPLNRQARELIECCPCPGSSNGGPGKLGRSQLRASDDDCPCRMRSTDSEGASSMLFPTRTAPAKVFDSFPIRSDSPADEVKNLLEPEVGLATSMLETLRKATEEEYQEALARDAARSVDVVPEESRNVVIIVNPRTSDEEDDFISEASNVKESRCINPLGTPLGTMRRSKPIKTLPDLFRLPKARQSSLVHNNPWDMDSNVGASNVQKSIVKIDGVEESRKPLLKLRTPLKENSNPFFNNDLKVPLVMNKLEEKLSNKPNIFERLNLPLIPKIKLDSPLQKNNKDVEGGGTSLAPSNAQEFIENEDAGGLFESSKRPLMFKNLLNLKDVELIPKTVPKRPIFRFQQNLNNLSPISRDANDKCDDSSYDSAMNEKVVLSDTTIPATDIEAKNVINSITQHISNAESDIEENKDTITSPSEVVPMIINNSKSIDTASKHDCTTLLADVTVISTTENIFKVVENDNNQIQGNGLDEILDTLQPSEIQEVTENKYSPSNLGEGCDNGDSDFMNKRSEIDGSNAVRDEVPFDFSEINSEETRNAEDNILKTEPNSKETSSSTRPFQPLSETLTNIKDNIRKSVESFKKSTKDLVPPNPHHEKSNNLKTDTDIVENTGDDNINETNNPESKCEKSDKVTLTDLQKLSDDLLVLSSNTEQNVASQDKNRGEDSDSYNFKSLKDIDHNDEASIDLPETESLDYTNLAVSEDVSTENTPKSCRTEFDETEFQPNDVQQFKSSGQDANDMSVEASSPIGKALPLNLNQQLEPSLLQGIDPLNLKEKLRSSMLPDLDSLILNLDPLNVKSLQNIIVQPTIPPLPEDPLNVLVKPITEVINLPTLENLRQKLSSVFENNDRSAENNFSDGKGDFTNIGPVEMVPAASTTSLRKVPSIKPLDDLNIDIFQLSPLSSTQTNLLSKTPKFNLNNFRARLPTPNNLELKPVTLESRVGNKKGNIPGASLNLGNDRSASRKIKPNTKLKTSNPLSDLPSLDELRNNLHSRTYDLLGNSLQPNLDLFRDSYLRSSIPDFDEIRRNAEKTMKGLHQKLKSTLKNGNHQNENFANPQDLLEDVNDKLKAIHYDLNDRLSSIHEDFLDQSRLKPLVFPTLPTLPIATNNLGKASNTFRKPKGKPAKLMKSASTISSQEISPFGNGGRNFNTQDRITPKRKQANLPPLLGAESSPVATEVEFPKSRTATDIPRKYITPLSQKTLSLKQPSFAKDMKRPILIKPNPLKNKTNKVTITFATTTPSSIISSVDKIRTTPSMQPEPNGRSFKDSLALAKPIIPADARLSASDITSLRASTPIKPKNNFKTANSDKSFPMLQSLGPEPLTKLRTSSLKGKESKLRLNDIGINKLNPTRVFDNNKDEVRSTVTEMPSHTSLVWPKSGDDSFLAKVREAMQARLNSFDPTKATRKRIEIDEVKSVNPNTDMLKSASENNDVVITEPLKENVSYKCKLVCTRE